MANTTGYGFPENDHRRVSLATVWVEQHQNDRAPTPESKRPARGHVRVMLLDDIPGGSQDIPNPVKGDIAYSPTAITANITKPIDQTERSNDYIVRCVASDQSVIERTWQLRVIDPARGQGVLTEPISEHATSAEVAAAINAIGCPRCTVLGYGDTLLDDKILRQWPRRQWHIFWPDGDWLLSTTRWLTDEILEYAPDTAEVPISLSQTTFEPTPFCEPVYLPYPRYFATPTAGTYATCAILPGLGLSIVDMECWSYVE